MMNVSPSSGACLSLCALMLGCQPTDELAVGRWTCSAAPLFIPKPDSGIAPGKDLAVDVGWRSDFEAGFCDYQQAHGFCYADPDAEYRLVDTPTHSGKRAAAFTITTAGGTDGEQTRCVREGLLPTAAYYGAWFYVPSGTASNGNWNLIHFQGATGDGTLHGLWDVSLSDDNDNFRPRVFQFRTGDWADPDPSVSLPRDAWFHLEFYWQRDATANGAIALYVDGTRVVQLDGIVTDDSDWSQWYVGNLADRLDPAESTIYVDDVSISGAPSAQ
jgi:hypothetical protein